MPRNVRNSWIDLYVDGRNDIGTGPVSKDGTMLANFYVRDQGRVTKSVRVSTRVYGEKLYLTVFDPEGNVVFEQETER